MKRYYDDLLYNELKKHEQMVFLSGPRQVGKTTCSQSLMNRFQQAAYYNWDILAHREAILQDPSTLVTPMLEKLSTEKPLLVLDEIHKRIDWKNYLKGLFDHFKSEISILVTGSARLDIYKRGGDSLMGRYFPYHLHPFTIGEITQQFSTPLQLIHPPAPISDDDFDALYQHGGFPAPFIQRDPRFSGRWQRLRFQQLFGEDIRDLNVMLDIKRMELLANLLALQSAQQFTYSSFSKKVRASVDTITRWVSVLENLYFCYLLRPWSHNMRRSLIKEPKVFLWDWTWVQNEGARAENFVASHLLKAVHFWTDIGLGSFTLHYLRDLDQNEVDFLVTQNGEPWFLVEVKNTDNHRISPALYDFQKKTGAKHAFQVILNMPYISQDCFSMTKPVIVPARTLLSQLP